MGVVFLALLLKCTGLESLTIGYFIEFGKNTNQLTTVNSQLALGGMEIYIKNCG